MSDGEFCEGQTWEAVAALAFHRLDNIGIYVDVNGQCCDGELETVMSPEPLAARLQAFGAQVCEVDGHDVKKLASAAESPRQGKPLFVLARTDPCRGLELLRKRSPKLHYLRFKTEGERREYELALKNLKDRE